MKREGQEVLVGCGTGSKMSVSALLIEWSEEKLQWDGELSGFPEVPGLQDDVAKCTGVLVLQGGVLTGMWELFSSHDKKQLSKLPYPGCH